ncbi:MAG TPA: type II toxin-antitoxin system Phd/YefM family antitoxin [Methylococcus sp.]|nr:type II toxin-antitoxin system Phd/YefM family antitoxin [Methylococcus sp.]
MPWNIAQAKQHFSEVVKQAAEKPQLIYNRSQPVAVLISADDYAAFEEWRKTRAKPPTLAEEFAEFRQILQEEGYEGLPEPPRTTRTNAFVQMLAQESGELSR